MAIIIFIQHDQSANLSMWANFTKYFIMHSLSDGGVEVRAEKIFAKAKSRNLLKHGLESICEQIKWSKWQLFAIGRSNIYTSADQKCKSNISEGNKKWMRVILIHKQG